MKINLCAYHLSLSLPSIQMFVNIPGVSLFEWHPFSLTSAPDDESDSVAIRELGGFTRSLRQVASTAAASQTRLYVRADGPYGHLPFDLHKVPVTLFFVGGIGITPVISALRHVFLAKNLPNENLYSVKKRFIYLVWSIQTEVRISKI